MDRTTPVRKQRTSTADLLTWTETPPANGVSPAPRSTSRSHQPSDGIKKVVFGGQVTDEEVESLNRRKPCSAHKLKEITGSGIFSANAENNTLESDADPTPNGKTGLRIYQKPVAAISHISFGDEEVVTPKKPVTMAEVAKQRELSGNLESEAEAKLKKQLSDAKCKELSGHNIFGPPPEIHPRPLAPRALALRESIQIGESTPENGQEAMIKTAKKILNQKFAELNGNGIFKGDTNPASAERSLSNAKLREISGNNIFADGKVESRDYFGGIRKPPGGGSSIALV